MGVALPGERAEVGRICRSARPALLATTGMAKSMYLPGADTGVEIRRYFGLNRTAQKCTSITNSHHHTPRASRGVVEPVVAQSALGRRNTSYFTVLIQSSSSSMVPTASGAHPNNFSSPSTGSQCTPVTYPVKKTNNKTVHIIYQMRFCDKKFIYTVTRTPTRPSHTDRRKRYCTVHIGVVVISYANKHGHLTGRLRRLL